MNTSQGSEHNWRARQSRILLDMPGRCIWFYDLQKLLCYFCLPGRRRVTHSTPPTLPPVPILGGVGMNILFVVHQSVHSMDGFPTFPEQGGFGMDWHATCPGQMFNCQRVTTNGSIFDEYRFHIVWTRSRWIIFRIGRVSKQADFQQVKFLDTFNGQKAILNVFRFNDKQKGFNPVKRTAALKV